MSKSLKKILVTGASLLMFASVGAGASSMNAHASVIVYPSQYRMIKHARGIRGTGMPHARVKAFGDNETSGYVRGHRIIIGNDGTVLSISGRRPTRAMFNSLFHHHVARRHYRRPVRRHIAKRTNRKATKRVRRHSVKRVKQVQTSANEVKPLNTRAYPVKLPKSLQGYWIQDDSTDMHVIGYHIQPGNWKYWKPVISHTINGRPFSTLDSYDFTRKGNAFYKNHGRYMFRRGYRPYALSLFHLKSRNRLQVGVQILSKHHRDFRKFVGTYYKVSAHRYHDIANGLDSLNIHHTND